MAPAPAPAREARADPGYGPYPHAKHLLISGSTGHPKVVINGHHMPTTNPQTLRFLDREKPVLPDWPPWSQAFSGNHRLELVLCTGGTMPIDNGFPLPGAIDHTLAHLRDVQPTRYVHVPKGYDTMRPAPAADDALARRCCETLRRVFHAGAGIPPSTWQWLEAVAVRVRRELQKTRGIVGTLLLEIHTRFVRSAT